MPQAYPIGKEAACSWRVHAGFAFYAKLRERWASKTARVGCGQKALEGRRCLGRRGYLHHRRRLFPSLLRLMHMLSRCRTSTTWSDVSV